MYLRTKIDRKFESVKRSVTKPSAEVVIQVVDAESGRTAGGTSLRIVERDEAGLVADTAVYDMQLMPSQDDPTQFEMVPVARSSAAIKSPTSVTNAEGVSVITLDPNKDYTLIVSKPNYRTQEIPLNLSEGNVPQPLEVALEENDCLTLSGSVISRGFNKEVPNARIQIFNTSTSEIITTASNLSGMFEVCLEDGYNYQILASKEGYQDGSSSVSTEHLRNNRSLSASVVLQPLSSNVLSKPLKEGTVIVLNDIYYDFGKSYIRKGSAQDLEAIAKLMRMYPSMEIELGAYTDSRGSNDANLKLSLQRAESARDFLLQRGINGYRIKAFGYGESKLRNHCSDGVECSEEEHADNRRTEIKVTKINEPIKFEYKKR